MTKSLDYSGEFKDLTRLVVRMETKVDNILNVTNDHETRIRVSESTLGFHTTVAKEHEVIYQLINKLDERVSPLEDIVSQLNRTMESFRKVLWAIALSIASGVGVLLFDIFRGGFNG